MTRRSSLRCPPLALGTYFTVINGCVAGAAAECHNPFMCERIGRKRGSVTLKGKERRYKEKKSETRTEKWEDAMIGNRSSLELILIVEGSRDPLLA